MKKIAAWAALISILAFARSTAADEEDWFVVASEGTERLAPEINALVRTGGTLDALLPNDLAIMRLTPEQRKRALLNRVEVAPAGDRRSEADPIREIIVLYKSAPPHTWADFPAGTDAVTRSVDGNFVVLRAANGVTSASVQALLENEEVRYIEPNYTITLQPPEQDEQPIDVTEATVAPDDPKFGKLLWGMHNIQAPRAWATATDSTVTVAVIDTGVDYTHEDLAANMWTNPGEKPGNGLDDDNNGIVDDVHGADFVNNDGDPMDDHRHGTHCAGTIGAVGNNSKGLVGVCWKVEIMALKFLNSAGSGDSANAAKCIDYARKQGAQILNNSYQDGNASTALKEAITRARKANILCVAAAGNKLNKYDNSPSYPASFTHRNIISVAAITNTNRLAYFSKHGKESVDLAAPGQAINSTVPGNRYRFMKGTSMAAPHVAGAAALVLAHRAYRHLSPLQVKSLLMRYARREPDLTGKCVTDGTLDVGFLNLRNPKELATSVQASTVFERQSITTKVTKLASLTFELLEPKFVQFDADSTVTSSSALPVRVNSGFSLNNDLRTIYRPSRREAIATKDVPVRIGTSLAVQLPAGRYTVRWVVWSLGSKIQLKTGAGALRLGGFPHSVGGRVVHPSSIQKCTLGTDDAIRCGN